MDDLVLLLVGLAVGAAAGYRAGLRDQPSERDGWQDEAIWWRDNATGIVGAKSDSPPVANDREEQA